MRVKNKLLAVAIIILLQITSPFPVLGKASVEINNSDSMRDLLQRNVGQIVEIRLLSGEILSGRLVRTTPTLLHLSKITGRNYFDAVIRIDHVSAMIVQVNQ
ncbi:MAG: hypothetical protein A2511_03155 [Deltaproteobacteria bacterium RIFOXYD12_FULL_50_9]|nr:MAG: hypothetical protein A2511_03155 [Deltaproteobacteria bacterium RIFOXYD12_FULL_50_9]